MDTLIEALKSTIAELQELVKKLLDENMRLEDEIRKLKGGK